jgi:hypothetical protein
VKKETEKEEEREEKKKRGETIEEIDEDRIVAKRGIYHGETSRTAYSRILDHVKDYTKIDKRKKVDETKEHFMRKHMMEHHEDLMNERKDKGEEEHRKDDFNFSVTGIFRHPTTRILNEAARVSLEEKGLIKTGIGEGKLTIMNTKFEFHLPKDVRIIFNQL